MTNDKEHENPPRFDALAAMYLAAMIASTATESDESNQSEQSDAER